MNGNFQRSVGLSLTICLLLLNGVVYVQTVEHAAHHAHHQAATHASVLCSWMCAAGQGVEGVTFGLQIALCPVAVAGVPVSQQSYSTAPLASLSRAPPPTFVSFS